MVTNKTYISITLGPITRAIDLADSTKELWAASYFFSYLAKQLIEPFRERHFLLPLVNDDRMWEPHGGAGLFPDRYIFESKVGDFEELKRREDKVLLKVATDILSVIKSEYSYSEIYKYLKSYLKIYFFEKEFNTENSKEIIPECERYMNLIEMQDSFPEQEKKNFLSLLFRNVNGIPKFNEEKIITGFNGTFLSKDAFGKLNTRLFESVIEISATELSEQVKDGYRTFCYNIEQEQESKKKVGLIDKQDEFLNQENICPYHKYIAIVKADGDSIGAVVEAMPSSCGTDNRLSKALLDFNVAVVETINTYRGKTVYIGGDDLLFFAPVYCDGKTIFELISEIDVCFKNCLKNELKDYIETQGGKFVSPTLSFGLSITYYKFPMFEALEAAGDLLEGIAKSGNLKGFLQSKGIVDKETLKPLIKKNKLAFSMQKHSGQMLTSVVCKEHASYEKFLEFVSRYTRKANPAPEDSGEKDSSGFLASVMHKIRSFEPMLEIILKEGESSKLLKNFFDNNFNEKEHEQYRGLFQDIRDLICASYLDYIASCEEYNTRINALEISLEEQENWILNPVHETVELVYMALRFIHFVNSKRDE